MEDQHPLKPAFCQTSHFRLQNVKLIMNILIAPPLHTGQNNKNIFAQLRSTSVFSLFAPELSHKKLIFNLALRIDVGNDDSLLILFLCLSKKSRKRQLY